MRLRYRALAIAALTLHAAFAAVTGTVVNKTTGKPQAGAAVGLNRIDPQNGIILVDQAKSGADGSFTINQDVPGDTPYLIRTTFDGVIYNHMMQPGTPVTGLSLEVYGASKQAGAARVSKHMILFEPSNGQMAINETYLFENDGQTTWNDPGNGTLHFFLPAAAEGKAKAEVTSPGGLPISAPVAKTARDGIFQIDYPVRPGETRFDLTYAVPYTEGQPYAGRIVTKDDNTYLIVPNGVTLNADGLNDLGQEPKTQAHLFGLATGAAAYTVQLTGSPVATTADSGADAGGGSGSPQIEQMMPRLYDKVVPILAVALGILALGFALLYRASGNSPAKENDERGRG